ncbi:MAG: CoA transferase [Sphingomonas adhaesiva]|uniref:CaiB/BaiF CoA-transferase family protein n=1 Tax=Sphingomonas adhaesiva TaxID=28212 RepID=UPI002FF7491E
MAAMIDLPLTGLRVVDMAAGPLAATARLLGELGAEVIRVEPPEGDPDRAAGPMLAGASLSWVANNLGKRATALDPTDAAFDALLADADVLIETTRPGSDAHFALDPAGRAARHPQLVVVSVSDFGQSGPWARWQATDAVLHALSGGLSRSGLPDREPLLPPGELTYQTAAVQAAYVALVAFVQRLRDGRGDHVDLSLLEAGMAALDPGFGVAGSAQSGVPAWKMSRGRVDERHRYPIIPCADGFVRMCVLAPRQWRGMWEWMGRPEQFAGPEWEKIQTRFRSPDLIPAMARFLADKTRHEIEEEGAARGIPCAGLLDLAEAVQTAQMTARTAFVPVEVASGVTATFPDGTIEIDGLRAGIRGGAPVPEPGAAFRTARPAWRVPAADRPLAGIRVLDMGIIVVGAETGRLLADQGADVVKVENGAFPDGQRQSRDDSPVSITFAAGHRNKRGLSIDLKSDEGRALFERLLREADVLLSNFKPGTLDGLGFTRERLAAINPALVAVDSSAFGPTGPWSRRLGYGPLVRCSAGLTPQWTYDGEPESFSDGITVYPDHVAARVGAVGAVALLIRRWRTGRGGTASVSQAEVMLGHMAAQIAAQSAGIDPPEREGPWGIYPAAGEDEWVVVTARDDADRAALARLIGDEPLADWTRARPAAEAASALQAAGVPAGHMLRVVELPDAPQFQALGTFRLVSHPLIDTPFKVEGAPARSRLPEPGQHPAPRIGEDSDGVLADWLGLSRDDIEDLLSRRVIEAPARVAA